jgi:hypothetical protein
MVILFKGTCPESFFIATHSFLSISVFTVTASISVDENWFVRKPRKIHIKEKFITHFFIHLNAFIKYLFVYITLSPDPQPKLCACRSGDPGEGIANAK